MKEDKKGIDFTVRVPVEIVWFDAQTWSGTADDYGNIRELEPIISHTCGYLVHEDKEKIIVSFLNFGDESSKHFQMIPKGMVKKIIKLERRK